MASITEVSKIAGVSPATVSNVINSRPGVAVATAQRVREAMVTLGYVPSPPARRTGPKTNMRASASRNRNIGIWFNSMFGHNVNFPFYSRIICSLERELRKLDLNTIIMNVHEDVIDSSINIEHIDGFIVFGTTLGPNCNSLISKANIKAVFILGYLEDSFGFAFDHIIPSNPYIGMLAAKYLIGRGHKTVGVINPERLHHNAMDMREDCFVNYAMVNETEAIRIHVNFPDRKNGTIISVADEPNVEILVQSYLALKHRPTGIFVPADSHLVVVHKAFSRAGVKIGRDVEFVGCNNEQETLAGLDIRPATIDIGVDRICSMAVERVQLSMEAKEPREGVIISVKPEIVEGENNAFDLPLQ